MSLDILGDGFDLHTGGLDLKFPHHENERAQAVALGHRFARHWMHHAFVEVAGEKMSKSLKNFTSLTDLLSRTDPRAYRLLVLQSHYRSPLEVTPETIEQAEGGLRRLDDFARRVATLPSAPPDAAVLAAFSAAMDDDLDTPRALASMFETVRDANAALDAGADDRAASLTAAVLAMCRAVGLELRAPDDAIDDTTAALVRALDEARAAKDWATGDTIRAQLQAAGWVVENTAEGTRIHR
jgi:cysteinyl-tRNA synthetase